MSGIVQTGAGFGVAVNSSKVASALEHGTAAESGVFVGKIVGIDLKSGVVFQSLGRGVGMVHLIDSLSRIPVVGENSTVKYKDGLGAVMNQQLAQNKGR